MSKRKSKYLGNCSPEHSFWSSNGSVFANYKQLNAGLRKMNKDTFSHHCNESKNDFHSWVTDVFGDIRLARQMKTAKSKTQMQRLVSARIRSLSSR